MSDSRKPLAACVGAYTRAVSGGELARAYRAILSALSSFKAAWEKAHPEDSVGALYQGYLDMSFISFAPALFAARRLKLSLVYLHAEGRFSLWLAAGNRAIQAEVSEQLRDRPLGKYALTELRPGVDAIVASEITPPYAFDEPEALAGALLSAAEAFRNDMIALLDF